MSTIQTSVTLLGKYSPNQAIILSKISQMCYENVDDEEMQKDGKTWVSLNLPAMTKLFPWMSKELVFHHVKELFIKKAIDKNFLVIHGKSCVCYSPLDEDAITEYGLKTQRLHIDHSPTVNSSPVSTDDKIKNISLVKPSPDDVKNISHIARNLVVSEKCLPIADESEPDPEYFFRDSGINIPHDLDKKLSKTKVDDDYIYFIYYIIIFFTCACACININIIINKYSYIKNNTKKDLIRNINLILRDINTTTKPKKDLTCNLNLVLRDINNTRKQIHYAIFSKLREEMEISNLENIPQKQELPYRENTVIYLPTVEYFLVEDMRERVPAYTRDVTPREVTPRIPPSEGRDPELVAAMDRLRQEWKARGHTGGEKSVDPEREKQFAKWEKKIAESRNYVVRSLTDDLEHTMEELEQERARQGFQEDPGRPPLMGKAHKEHEYMSVTDYGCSRDRKPDEAVHAIKGERVNQNAVKKLPDAVKPERQETPDDTCGENTSNQEGKNLKKETFTEWKNKPDIELRKKTFFFITDEMYKRCATFWNGAVEGKHTKELVDKFFEYAHDGVRAQQLAAATLHVFWTGKRTNSFYKKISFLPSKLNCNAVFPDLLRQASDAVERKYGGFRTNNVGQMTFEQRLEQFKTPEYLAWKKANCVQP